jgi:hypothetical protein
MFSGAEEMGKVTGERRKLHCGELHILYSSPGIIRQIKSSRMKWLGHVARMGEGRMRSKCTLGILVGGVWSGFTWLSIGIIGGLL